MKLIKFSDITLKTSTNSKSESSPPKGNIEAVHTHNPTHVDNLSNDSKAEVVIDSKTLPKGAWFGHISNGGGSVPFEKLNLKLNIISNEKWVTTELVACGSKPRHQTWQKAKKVKQEKPKAPEINNQGQVEL